MKRTNAHLIISDKHDCYGCTACMHSCNKNAIQMKMDSEGFEYPAVDTALCVGCEKCIRSCPSIKNNTCIEETISKFETTVYAVRHKDENVVLKSRSGGCFTALSDYILNSNGAVYGCVLDNDISVHHIRSVNETLRDNMRGSKYVQSNLQNVFVLIRNDLEQGTKVIFSGTPCQVDGLKHYLKKEYSNLFCIDVVCHGVMSPKVWKSFIKWKLKRKKFISFDFRNKIDFGWKDHKETIIYSSKDRIYRQNSAELASLYYSNYMTRPSCYRCKYKSIHRVSDITLGDFWGIEKVVPDMDDNKGVSLVMVNTPKGQELFNNCIEKCEARKVSGHDFIQKALIAPYEEPTQRRKKWRMYSFLPFGLFIRWYSKGNIISRCIFHLKKIMGELSKHEQN